MKSGVLVIERLVMESLEKKQKNILELVDDTGLKKKWIVPVLYGLKGRGILKEANEVFEIDYESKVRWLPVVNKREFLKSEVSEIFRSIINQKFSGESGTEGLLNLKKIWLTNEEEKVFKALFSNLEQFVDNVQGQRRLKPQKERIGEQKVILWAYSSYQNLIENLISVV